MNISCSNSPDRRIADTPTRPFTDSPLRRVAMGEGVVTRESHIISSSGLGSCVAVTIYDTKRKIGGLAHIMLPDSSDIRMRNDECGLRNKERQKTPQTEFRNKHSALPNPQSPIPNPQYQCADTAISALLEELKSKGVVRRDLVAKMVGGARMFSSYDDSNSGVGKQNIMSIKRILRKERIPLIGEDVGGHHGRNIEFHLDSGKVIVRAMGKGDRVI
jgi:chemotaxis protein CheD